jgi:hypothetical protein
LTVPESVMPIILPIRPPAGAPSVVIVLLGDVGFGAAETFRRSCENARHECVGRGRPALQPVLQHHALFPLRAALLTGRTSTTATSRNTPPALTATTASSRRARRPSLRFCAATPTTPPPSANGTTPRLGDQHGRSLQALADGLGFEECGFMAGDTPQYFPGLFHDTAPVDRPERVKDYYLTADLADRAVAWMSDRKVVAPDKAGTSCERRFSRGKRNSASSRPTRS